MINYNDFANLENQNNIENKEVQQHNSNNTGSEIKPTDMHTPTNEANSANSHSGEAHSGGNVFTELLSGMGDHHGFYLFDKHITDLPIIIYDKQEGFHFYPTEHSMEEGKLFKMVHGKGITKVSDDQPVTLDLSITNLVFFQWMSIAIILICLKALTSWYKKGLNKAPKGFINMFELGVEFVRDNIVYKSIPNRQVADRLLPYFIALHFFILVMNFFGLFPGGHTPTGDIGTTAGLALTALFVINYTSIREIGIWNYIKHLTGGAPWWLWPIMVPIEIISIFTKPFALTVRLFANMTAGHVMLFVLIGLVFFFKSLGAAPVTIGFSVFILTLEFLVAVVQAYIFTILTAVFTGVAIASHDDHGHGKESHH